MKNQAEEVWRAQGLEPMADFFNTRAAQYDEAHTGHIDGGRGTKALAARFLPEGVCDILDLGCGTGLELPAVFARFPGARVLGIDVANEMLALLRARCVGCNVQTLCMDYLDYAYPHAAFDAVISVMSLHHFTPEQKLDLYGQICGTLRPGGVFINCDYMVDTPREERVRFCALLRLHMESQATGLPGKFHLDIPLTPKHELRLLRQAGLRGTALVWRLGNTKVVRGWKR
ncbi:MAG: class I SAM-dependent methyltransferase [Oscillospiraceae bacterium]|jgi:tRNA (cmo5U34)-methyltransferase|nr:class I SAM-dependent methyltransferase [Oscillospiraceae bacterium]